MVKRMHIANDMQGYRYARLPLVLRTLSLPLRLSSAGNDVVSMILLPLLLAWWWRASEIRDSMRRLPEVPVIAAEVRAAAYGI